MTRSEDNLRETVMTSVGSVYDYLDTGRNSSNNRTTASSDGSFDDIWKQTGAISDDGDAESAAAIESSPGGISITSGASVVRFADLIAAGKLKPINIAELPEDKYQSFMEGDKLAIDAHEKSLESRYTSRPELPENDPRTKTYATIVIAGKVVVTIDNQGCIGGHDGAMARLDGLLPDEVNGTNGPALAKARAEAAAAILGGRLIMSSTAISQPQFNALPSLDTLQPLIDYDAMKNDPDYQQLEQMREHYRQTELDRAAYLAKQETGEPAT